MIIDNNNKNNFNVNNSFQNKINKNITNTDDKTSIKNVLSKDIFSINGGNTNSNDVMYDKSVAMLNDRLEKGTISFEEFTKKCNDIAKKRNRQ